MKDSINIKKILVEQDTASVNNPSTGPLSQSMKKGKEVNEMREKAKRLAREEQEEEEESKNETPQPKSFQKKGLQRTYNTIGALLKRASVIQVGVI